MVWLFLCAKTSERSSSSKGKSNIPNTKGSEQSQVKNAVIDSTSDTTKQVPATCKGLEDETPTTTAASRKGRRGAMRVTIEADESEEEDVYQESSTKRGSRGKKAVQEESNKNGRSSTGDNLQINCSKRGDNILVMLFGSRRQHGRVVRQFRARVLLWRLAGFVLGHPKFKS